MTEETRLSSESSDSVPQLPESVDNHRLGIALAIVLLGLSLMLGLAVWVTFHQARSERVHHAGSVSRLLEASITRTLESVEIALLGLAERSRSIAASGQRWQELASAVGENLRFSPHMRQILVARGDTVLYDSRQAGTGMQRLDRQGLRLRAPGVGGFNLGLRIGDPLAGRFLPIQGVPLPAALHSQILPVALSLDATDGDAVTVYAALNPHFFITQMARADFGGHSGAVLLGLDGVLLTGQPDVIGRWPSGTLEALGEALKTGTDDGYLVLAESHYRGREIAYRLSSRYPLAVLILVDHRDTLAVWWQRNRYLLSSSGLVVVGLVLGGILLIREIQRRLSFQGQARLLGQAVAQSATAVLVTDPAGRVLYANAAYIGLSGVCAGEIAGRPMDLQLTDGQPESQADCDPTQADAPWTGECQIRGRDGRSIWILLSVSPVRDRHGKVVHRICTQVDITERKQAEENLRIAATAFESQEGMMVTDAQGVILRVNRAFCALTGFNATEAVGKTPAILHSGRQSAAFYQQMWSTLQRQQRWQGELWNRRKNGEIYPEWLTISGVSDASGQVTHYVASFTDISQRKAAEAEIQRLAFFDALSNLPNRRLLLDRLHHALAASARSNCHGALLFIDLDNFKILNDTRGHQVGDQLLVEVARRLLACVRELDTVARLGGDEFVVLLEGLDGDQRLAIGQAERVASKILQALHRPYEFGSYQHHSSASIGVNLFQGREVGVDELLKRADVAMYRAKAAGRNTVRLFDPHMQATLEARARLEQALRQALPERQLLLYLQPQVNRYRQFIGAEALLRWQHPELGMVNPGDFIPLAEESELIFALGHWAISTACGYLRDWQTDVNARHLTLAVNVSARQFRQADFVARVLDIVHRSDIDPSRLKLELTESLMLHDVNETIVRMQALKEAGIGLSMDDFGTGQSSLAYLKALPLDQLKIDRSFVQDLPHDSSDVAIVQTIIAMAHSLELDVIAEGVETVAQAAFLSQHGCQSFQGYLYGRPMTESAFRAALAEERCTF